MNCPLCEFSQNNPFYTDEAFFGGVRHFYECEACRLIFVPESGHIGWEEEKVRYGLHENSPDDAGYVSFLNQLIAPLRQYIKPGSLGLDYGCGPGPAVKNILQDLTENISEYDPHFRPDTELLSRPYDFCVATEVIEHFRHPKEDFGQIDRLVRPGGIIGLMTDQYREGIDFANWGYKNDPTHIMFYQKDTFAKIADLFKWEILEMTSRIVIFKRG